MILLGSSGATHPDVVAFVKKLAVPLNANQTGALDALIHTLDDQGVWSHAYGFYVACNDIEDFKFDLSVRGNDLVWNFNDGGPNYWAQSGPFNKANLYDGSDGHGRGIEFWTQDYTNLTDWFVTPFGFGGQGGGPGGPTDYVGSNAAYFHFLTASPDPGMHNSAFICGGWQGAFQPSLRHHGIVHVKSGASGTPLVSANAYTANGGIGNASFADPGITDGFVGYSITNPGTSIILQSNSIQNTVTNPQSPFVEGCPVYPIGVVHLPNCYTGDSVSSSTSRIAVYWIGDYLTSAQMNTLNTALHTFMADSGGLPT